MEIKRIGLLFMMISVLAACQNFGETMDLLDERIQLINVSKSNGFGGMNEDFLYTFEGDQEMQDWERIITNASIQEDVSLEGEPMYDVMVQYQSSSGELPTHGLHLWLGSNGEPSTLTYIESEDVYQITEADTELLRALLIDN